MIPAEARMRRDLMEILACPICKGELTLTATAEESGEVIAGSLHCAHCNETYPIEDGIPNLLPPDLRRAMASDAAAPSGHP
jgi:uncharacterized protein YbaR (Trm112 family)